MREIKFRAWDGTRMHKVLSFHQMPNGKFHVISTSRPTNVKFFNEEIITDDLLEFTGLHDKRGDPIFEGDIIQSQASKCLLEDQGEYVISTREEHTGFFLIRTECFTVDEYWHCLLDCGEIEALGLKVIGNIHENPELIP